MFSDDVYRSHLSDTIAALETWARSMVDCAKIDTEMQPSFWRMSVAPLASGPCPFELVLRADQRFNARIGDEVYEDKPVDAFSFFPMLVRAIADGRVERVSIISALTGMLEVIETHVTLEDGWAWIGERRLATRSQRKSDAAQVQRTHRFLPYRRK